MHVKMLRRALRKKASFLTASKHDSKNERRKEREREKKKTNKENKHDITGEEAASQRITSY